MKSFALIAVILVLLALPVMAQEKPSEARLITVGGIGEVKVKPDFARVSLGVTTTQKDTLTATRQNATRTQSVTKALLSLGISPDDIQTDNFRVSPVYGDQKTGRILRGYTVENSILVTVRVLPETGRVIDQAIKAGANVFDRVDFDLNETTEDKARAEALEKAIANAQQKAEVMAKTIKVKNWSLQSLTEGSELNATYRNAGFGGGYYAPTNVRGGYLVVTAGVTLRYSFSRDDKPNSTNASNTAGKN